MKKRKIIVSVSLTVALTASFLSFGIANNRAQGVTNKETTTAFLIEDDKEILAPSQWVEKSLREINKIRPGMKRADLNNTFTADGGISSRTHGRYIYREAAIKIDVEFEPADDDGRGAEASPAGESDEDVIKKVSRPYLELAVND